MKLRLRDPQVISNQPGDMVAQFGQKIQKCLFIEAITNLGTFILQLNISQYWIQQWSDWGT